LAEQASRTQQQKPRELIHEILPVGMLQCNCHIVGDPITREAMVIDPGDDVARILESLSRHRLTLRAILITHAHIDHVGGMATLHNSTGAPVMMHRDDVKLYRLLPTQASWLGTRTPATGQVDQFLREGESLRWGASDASDGFELQVLHTPGHSEGSVSLYLPRENAQKIAGPGLLFAGDTLFAGSIGRTDLWYGSMEQIMRSLREKLLELPDDTIVFPGHGASTTIGEERESNPFLQNA
jgi:glyoxylase-like metal-dependent hydrolase (beta-lactamase superfamily II)